MGDFSNDYLLDQKIKIFQPLDGYRASSDAVILSSAVKSLKKNDKILDLGSGTGAISLCLAYRFPQNSVIGFELQKELVELSRQSAEANGFANLDFCECDLRQPQSRWFGQYEHVITNPPYADDDMQSPNCSKAYAHNFQNFSLESWLYISLKCLTPQGKIYIINRAEAISRILSVFEGKVGNITIVPLYSKSRQKAKRVLICATKNNKTPAVITSGLIIHNQDGSYTDEARRILREGQSLFDVLPD